MRFDEADERDAYRRGARDCFECLQSTLNHREIKNIKAWLDELERWEHSEPPPPPLI